MPRGTRAIAVVVAIGGLAIFPSPPAPASDTTAAGADRAAEPWFDPEPVNVSGTYERQLVGDWNGDGHDDIVWYGPGGDHDGLWFGNPGGFSHHPLSISRTYQDILVGDYDGDGRDDLLFYAPGAATDGLWLGRADGSFTHKRITVNGTYDSVIVGDYSGDGRDDVFWYGMWEAHDALWLGRPGGAFTSRPVAVQGGYVDPLVGDFDGDHHDDLRWSRNLWYGEDDGRFDFADWRESAPARERNPARKRLVGDFNADGHDDLISPDYAYYGLGRGQFQLWWLPDADPDVPETCKFGSFDGHIGDFNGDGLDDVFWQHGGETDQLWLRGNASSQPAIRCFLLFIEDDYTPFVLDYDGDGHDDVFLYGPGAAHDSLWAGD